MYCLDSTFCIDLANGRPGAVDKSRELDGRGERLAIPAPALTEFLVGAFARGGRQLVQALELASQLEVWEITEGIAIDAARLGGECARRGTPVGAIDLLVAAAARHHGAIVLSTDEDFSRIPGTVVETY